MTANEEEEEEEEEEAAEASEERPDIQWAALRNYEDHHKLPSGTATLDQVKDSSAGVAGWAAAGPYQASSAPSAEPAPAAESNAAVELTEEDAKVAKQLGIVQRTLGDLSSSAVDFQKDFD